MGRKTKFNIDLGLAHVKVKKIEHHKNGDYHIYVSCTATSAHCHKCGKPITKPHGQCKETIIEHMPVLGDRVFIHVQWPRFICTECEGGPTTSFHPDWLGKTGKFTKAFENFFLKMLVNSTVKDIAIKFQTTEEILQGIIDRYIATEIDWSNLHPTRIGMDEIALKKGHDQYLTIISDVSKGSNVGIIAVLDGRTKEDVVPFLRTIPRDVLLNLESICVDMGAGYFASLRDVINDDHIFNNIVTIDRFHVAKLIGTAVDNERKSVIKELKKKYAHDEEALNIIKNSMWPLRHHFDDLSPNQQEKLDNLFILSPYLEHCYDLREELYLIFEGDYSKEEAKVQIINWCSRALECSNGERPPFESFVKTYTKFEDNILNYFEARASSGPVEGLNNKIKMIKRRGFGFRNVLQFAQRLFLDINYKFQLLPNCY
ncbi:MAG: ISL3 family transposase [Deltaproteobacteria bacterium]|nr:ISL3 family transposase [Deltaproteobacteria bacterium]